MAAETPSPARPTPPGPSAPGPAAPGTTAPGTTAPHTNLPAAGPGRRGTVLRSIGTAVALLVLVAGAASLVTQFFAQERITTTTVTEPVTRLVARTGTGDVRVRQVAADTPVTVRTRVRWAFREPRTTVHAGNGLLTVAGSCDTDWSVAPCDTDFEISLPPGVVLDITTSTGDIRASGSAAVAARTDTGDITLTVPGSGTVEARTNTGDVTVTGGAADALVRARTDTGDVSLTLAEAPRLVRGLTGTGDVTITVPAGSSYHVAATSDTGDTRVSIPEDRFSQRTLEASADTGTVVVRTG